MTVDPFNIEGEQLKWFELAPPDLSPLQDFGNLISDGLRMVKAQLELVRTANEAIALLVTSTADLQIQALNAAITAMVNAVDAILAQLVGSLGVYVLPIPPPKKGLYRLIAKLPGDSSEETNLVRFPANSVMARGTPEEQAALRRSAVWTQVLNPTDLFSGGNAYFIKTLAESLFDAEDPNRPKFGASSNWAYAILLAGASDMPSLVQLLGFLQGLVDGGSNANQVGVSQNLGSLVPQGVRVTPSAEGSAAIVEWDLVPVSQVLDSYDQATVEAVSYAIIRSTGMEARTATKVNDLFATNALVSDLTGSYGAKVLAVKTYDGVVTRYLDTSPLETGVTYYYHVAFATQIRPAGPGAREAFLNFFEGGNTRDAQRIDSEPKVLGYDLLSGCIQYRKPTSRAEHCTASLGKAPDWLKSPSIGLSIPAIGNFIDLIREYLRKFTSTTGNITAQNTAFIQFLNREIARYTALVASIERRIQQVISVFAVPSVGIHATLRYGHGGVSSFLTNVTESFEDPTDGNRPQFTNGDEFVSGLVFLAVGPDLAPIKAALEIFKLLFNPDRAADPVLAGVQSINTQLASLEASLLLELEGETLRRATSPVTFNEDMTPRGDGQGDSTCDP